MVSSLVLCLGRKITGPSTVSSRHPKGELPSSAAAVQGVLQSRLTLCDPIGGNPPGSPS